MAADFSLLDSQFIFEAEHEVSRPAGGYDHCVGHGLPQFSSSGAGILRDREGFVQSGGTAERHRASRPDQSLGLQVQNFVVLEIKFIRDIHLFSFPVIIGF